MTGGPVGAVVPFFYLVDTVRTEELSPIPLASTGSLVRDFFCFFEVLMALALFAELKALPSVAFNAMALPSTLLD
jgi:hypothetical protein